MQVMNTSDFPTTLTMTTFWPGGNNVSVRSLGTSGEGHAAVRFRRPAGSARGLLDGDRVEQRRAADRRILNFFAFENGSQLWRAGDTVEGLILNWGSTVPIQP